MAFNLPYELKYFNVWAIHRSGFLRVNDQFTVTVYKDDELYSGLLYDENGKQLSNPFSVSGRSWFYVAAEDGSNYTLEAEAVGAKFWRKDTQFLYVDGVIQEIEDLVQEANEAAEAAAESAAEAEGKVLAFKEQELGYFTHLIGGGDSLVSFLEAGGSVDIGYVARVNAVDDSAEVIPSNWKCTDADGGLPGGATPGELYEGKLYVDNGSGGYYVFEIAGDERVDDTGEVTTLRDDLKSRGAGKGSNAIGVDDVSDHPEIQTAQDMLNSLWATQQSHASSISQLQSDVHALGTVTLEGDTLVYPGSTNTYTITNFDSFSQYEVSASRETVTRSNDTITFTVDVGAEDGEVEINVKRDGRDNIFVLAIGAAGVRTPTITQPVNDAVVGSLAPTIKTDAFVAYPAGVDSHVSTDWEVATDAGFSNVVWSSMADTVNKVEVTLPNGVLSPETEYYVRARHNGATYQSSFSSAVKFTTPAHYIVTPSITEPTDGAIDIGESPILKCTAFESIPESYDTHKSTSWRVRRKSDGVVVWELLQSTSNLTSVTVPAGILAESTEYEALVRHEGYTLGAGSWSAPVSFTTDDQFVPSEPGTPFGGGFFVGLYTDNGDTYALVVAPKSAEIDAPWKTSSSATSGTDSVIDGLANSNAMNNTTHPAAKYCRDYRGGGFDDWSLPAQNQLEVAYYELKPGTNSNHTSSGTNPNAVPPRNSNYTTNNPSQTSIAAFRSGGAQAFDTEYYWSSTQSTAGYAIGQNFGKGTQANNNKVDANKVRPFRAVKIS